MSRSLTKAPLTRGFRSLERLRMDEGGNERGNAVGSDADFALNESAVKAMLAAVP